VGKSVWEIGCIGWCWKPVPLQLRVWLLPLPAAWLLLQLVHREAVSLGSFCWGNRRAQEENVMRAWKWCVYTLAGRDTGGRSGGTVMEWTSQYIPI
jgi:hypothetical protein